MRKLLFIAGLFMPMLALAQTVATTSSHSVTSPDGKLVVNVISQDGKPSYNIVYGGVEFLGKSPLGVKCDLGDFTSNMTLESEKSEKLDQKYTVPTIKSRNVHYVANETIYKFTQNGKPVYDIQFRVSNNDVAFRYHIYPQKNKHCCVINQELTGFTLPDGSTTFLCPQSKPMQGFGNSSPSYETSYTVDDVLGKNGWGEGYTFPCLFRNGDKGWVLISETGVSSKYCASRLMGGNGNTYSIGFPNQGECNGNGTAAPGLALPGDTPWRTITIGKTLAPIVETTVPFDVVEPLYEASQEYVYGKGSWSWIIGMDSSCNFDEQKRYVDFSSAMGYQSVLVDALWDVQIGKEKMAELSKYAKSKNVGLFLWYNSNGYWNSAPQSPRGIMDNAIERKKEMKWLKSIGVKGLKVDFFGGDKQMMMQLYEDILSDANEYGLMVISHGCTLPRGWERMYPNFVASEAVLASENMHFGQGSCDAEAFNVCLHTFIRNTVGSMDFGGSTLNKFYNANNDRGTRRMTSDVCALATAVLYQSAMQHFAMAPNNLTDAPAWAIDFMKRVPTQWDEVKYIDGYPGKYVVIARRCGEKWYIAAVNAQKEALNIKVKLPMLAAGSEYMEYTDNDKLEGTVKKVKMNKKQEVKLYIPCNGAYLAETAE